MNNIEEIYESYSLDKESVYSFLEDLRISGEVNMYGAYPCLQDFYGFSRREAIDVLNDWMKNYDDWKNNHSK